MDQNYDAKTLVVGEWRADLRTGRLHGADETRDVEPKVMDLLFLLAARPTEVFARQEILAALWPDTIVGDDALARCVFKLRRALGDDPRAPRFIETIPKRGYRLIARAAQAGPHRSAQAALQRPSSRRSWIVGGLSLAAGTLTLVVALIPLAHHAGRSDPSAAATLKSRADEYYFQFTRSDNEAAIALYERVLDAQPDDATALAGLANGIVQRVVRWSGIDEGAAPRSNLRDALARGALSTPEATRQLPRAQVLAERAVKISPDDPAALKSLGLVLSVQQRFADARAFYRRALASDPNAWGTLIDLADLDDIDGQHEAALQDLERAYAIMTRVYESQVARVRPWYADLGALIADRLQAADRLEEAEGWYRRVLALSPVHAAATAGLASTLARNGDFDAAHRLCVGLVERTGPTAGCERFMRRL